MKRWLIALGEGTGAMLESAVYAACADDMLDSTGTPLEELTLLTLSCNPGDSEAYAAWARAEGIRRMLDDADEPSPCFHTLLDWQERRLHRVATPASGRDRFLARALLGSRGDTMMAMAAQIHAAAPDTPIGELAERMRFEGENEAVLCVNAGDETGAALLPMLARYLTENAGEHLRLGAVVLLDTRETDDGLEKNGLCGTLLDTLARPELREALPVLYLIGLPAGMNDGEGRVSFADWIAARQAARFFAAQDKPGVYTVRFPDVCLSWQAFGKDESRCRRYYGGMLLAAQLFRTTLHDEMETRLDASGRLGEGLLGWPAAFLRGVSKKTPQEKQRLKEQLSAVQAFMTAYTLWMSGMLAALPQGMKQPAQLEQLVQDALAAYRTLLDAVGRLYLMEDEIRRSDMDNEHVVRRTRSENDVDRLLRSADDQYDLTDSLTEEQEALNRAAGGWARQAMLRRMLRGIDRALQEEGNRADALRSEIETLENAARQKDMLYRLETHMRILAAQRERAAEDLEAAMKPDKLSELPLFEKEAVPLANHLFDPETLLRLRAEPVEDRKVRKKNDKDLEARLPMLVKGNAGMTAHDVLNTMTVRAKGAAVEQPVALMLACLLAAVIEG